MLNFEIRYTKALVILCILTVIFIGLSFVLPNASVKPLNLFMGI